MNFKTVGTRSAPFAAILALCAGIALSANERETAEVALPAEEFVSGYPSEEMPVMSESTELYEFPGYILPVQSLEQLMEESDEVVLARTGDSVGEYWVPGPAELFVQTQFEIEVIETLAGGLTVGSRIVVHVPGGAMARVGNPQPGGSFRPVEGEETMYVEYAEFPMPEPGGTELMFLSRVTADDGTEFWLQARPEARFEVQPDGNLVSVLKRTGARTDDFESWLVGGTLEEARRRVQAATAD